MNEVIFTHPMASHEKYMRRCLDLARLGKRRVAPNPMVGAVLVHNDRIMAEGLHQKYGGPHAEVEAINAVAPEDKDLLSQSTLYVSLEPCSHYGKTPPCADLIVKNNIPEVVVASMDPNPLVEGKGLEKLRKAGIKVTEEILKDEAEFLNRRFYIYHREKRPYIILKWAQSKDGYISRKNEQTRISNSLSQRITHKWRSEEQAVMIGRNTAAIDDPQLNVRLWQSSHDLQPLRIIIDTELILPHDLNIYDHSLPTLIVTKQDAEDELNIKYISIKKNAPLLPQLLEYCYKKEIQSILVEGGAKLHQSFLDEHLWDEIRVFTGKGFLGSGIEAPHFHGQLTSEEKIGDNLLQIFKQRI